MQTTTHERGWYWQEHADEYNRFKVGDLPQFCGWEILLKLIKEAERTMYYTNSKPIHGTIGETKRLRHRLIRRDQALIATAFETGGRITEVLNLKRENFTLEPDKVIIKNMPIVKRWKKVKETIEKWKGTDDPPAELGYHFLTEYGGWVRRKFVTEPVFDRRVTLEIPMSDPLTPYISAWVEKMTDYIFPNYAKDGNPPMSRIRAYQIVRNLGERIGLFKRDPETGEAINNHVCNHWFRSMRASQLAEEKNFLEEHLKRFFSWKSDTMASRYAKLSPAKLGKWIRDGVT